MNDRRFHTHSTRGTPGRAVGLAAAIALVAAGCGGSDQASDEPHQAEPGEALVSVAGYDYLNSEGDPTAAAVIDAYESWHLLPPPIEASEDFDSGAGPFWTGSEGGCSVEAVDGALRITNSDADLSCDSYVDLDAEADSIFVIAAITLPEQLQADEGPALTVSQWDEDGQDLVAEYEFGLDGESAYLFEATGPDDVRLLDSASLPAGLTGEVNIALWVMARGDSPGIVGFLGEELIVEADGATGTFDSVSLRAWSVGAPVTVEFEWATVRALAAGEEMPDLFSDRSEHSVDQEGTPVATIVVLEPSPYLDNYPEVEDEQALPAAILGDAAPDGMSVESAQAGGDSIVQGEMGDSTFWVWRHEQFWNVVTAQDAVAGKAFVEAYIAAEHAADPQAHAAGS